MGGFITHTLKGSQTPTQGGWKTENLQIFSSAIVLSIFKRSTFFASNLSSSVRDRIGLLFTNEELKVGLWRIWSSMLLLHTLALLMTWLRQTAGHKMLMLMFSQLFMSVFNGQEINRKTSVYIFYSAHIDVMLLEFGSLLMTWVIGF